MPPSFENSVPGTCRLVPGTSRHVPGTVSEDLAELRRHLRRPLLVRQKVYQTEAVVGTAELDDAGYRERERPVITRAFAGIGRLPSTPASTTHPQARARSE
jgi:hypothetical protein